MIDKREDSVLFAIQPEDVVVIRVNGRGTFKNSVGVQQFAEQLIKEGKKPRFILDLHNCISMDSTFMGVLAGIGRNQMNMSLGKMTAVNLNPQTERLLSTLGLTFILDVRTSQKNSLPDDSKFFERKTEKLSLHDQTIHMLEAHQKLIDIDTQNEARFQNVIFYLKDSLSREQNKPDGSDTENSEQI